MSSQVVLVLDRFPQENIHSEYGAVTVKTIMATVTMSASNPSSDQSAISVTKAVLHCSGILDSHTIIIDDPSLLSMFVVQGKTVGIDLNCFDQLVPVFGLVPARSVPSKSNKQTIYEDFEILRNAWKICRLVWGYRADMDKLNKRWALPSGTATTRLPHPILSESTAAGLSIDSSEIPLSVSPNGQ
ncbi:hypothetical protein HRS9139_04558 [Pyrenophora teres f. teres]|nr:hypothetical protein HRS9139_04558 [Pyrenophora teres f. teres]